MFEDHVPFSSVRFFSVQAAGFHIEGLGLQSYLRFEGGTGDVWGGCHVRVQSYLLRYDWSSREGDVFFSTVSRLRFGAVPNQVGPPPWAD